VKHLLLLRFWNYIRGYVIIVIEGYFLEKFINICLHRQIFLWDIRRVSERKMTFRVSIKGFRLLRPIARKTKCRVRIKAKRGLPFLVNRYRKRKTFIFGALVFLALLYIMTSFIWSVDITGNETLDDTVIMEKLKEHGLYTGALKFGINTKQAVSDIMLDMAELSWISLDLKGTRLKVEVRERIPIPEIIPQKEPCSIIATKDALVIHMVVKEGIEAVKTGDTVIKGQELISGKIPVKNEKDIFRLVHSMGTVEAKTWYREEFPVETEKVEEARSGESYSDYSLVFFSKKFDLFHKKSGYEFYEKEELRKILSIGNDLVFPFELLIDKYYETTPRIIEVDEQDAMEAAADKAYEALMEIIPEEAEITDTETTYQTDSEGKVSAKVTIECREEIGVEQRIGGEE
jgi:similar to stage IV sporulation protein